MTSFLGALAIGAVAGLASIPHCLGMCGPFAAFATTRGEDGGRTRRLVEHQLGRVIAYSAAGALAGAGGAAIAGALFPSWSAWLLSLLIAAAMVASAVRMLWPRRASGLVPLGRRSRVRERILSVVVRAKPAPAVLGGLTVLFPCGALYSALAISAGTGGAGEGAAAMLAFAVASGPGLAAAGWAGARALESQRGRRTLALAMIVGALLVVLRPLAAVDEGPACHDVSPPAASE